MRSEGLSSRLRIVRRIVISGRAAQDSIDPPPGLGKRFVATLHERPHESVLIVGRNELLNRQMRTLLRQRAPISILNVTAYVDGPSSVEHQLNGISCAHYGGATKQDAIWGRFPSVSSRAFGNLVRLDPWTA